MEGQPPEPSAEALAPAETTPLGEVNAPIDRFAELRRVPRLAFAALGTVRDAAGRPLARSVACQLVLAVLVGVQVYILKELISGLIELSGEADAATGDVTLAFVALVLVGAFMGVLNAVLMLQERLVSELVGRHVMDRIIDVSTKVPLSLLEDPEYYDHLQRATTAGTFRPLQMVSSLMALLLGLLTSVGIMVALFTLQPVLVPLVVIAAVPVLASTLFNSRQSYTFEYQMTSHARERLHLMELFTEREAAKELRVFSAIGYLRRRYDRLSDERIVRVREFIRGRFTVALVGTLGTSAGTAIALGALIALLVNDRIDAATATAAAAAMVVLGGRLSAVSGALGTLLESSLYMTDLQRFLAQGEQQAERAGGEAEPGPFQEMRFENVSFSYPGTEREVLHDVSLDVRRGEVVALVGENGSGKTTLVKLLCRLYEHGRGQITWNGRDVSELQPGLLRAGMTVLFQDFVRYHLTVEENIGLGRADVPLDREWIEESARTCRCRRARVSHAARHADTARPAVRRRHGGVRRSVAAACVGAGLLSRR